MTIFGESDARDWSLMSAEVGHVRTFLQVPDLHHRVLRARPKDQTIRMELGASQS